MSDDEFRSKMHDSVKEFLEDSPFDEERWEGFAKLSITSRGMSAIRDSTAPSKTN